MAFDLDFRSNVRWVELQ